LGYIHFDLHSNNILVTYNKDNKGNTVIDCAIIDYGRVSNLNDVSDDKYLSKGQKEHLNKSRKELYDDIIDKKYIKSIENIMDTISIFDGNYNRKTYNKNTPQMEWYNRNNNIIDTFIKSVELFDKINNEITVDITGKISINTINGFIKNGEFFNYESNAVDAYYVSDREVYEGEETKEEDKTIEMKDGDMMDLPQNNDFYGMDNMVDIDMSDMGEKMPSISEFMKQPQQSIQLPQQSMQLPQQSMQLPQQSMQQQPQEPRMFSQLLQQWNQNQNQMNQQSQQQWNPNLSQLYQPSQQQWNPNLSQLYQPSQQQQWNPQSSSSFIPPNNIVVKPASLPRNNGGTKRSRRGKKKTNKNKKRMISQKKRAKVNMKAIIKGNATRKNKW
jgi:hypothetical protein